MRQDASARWTCMTHMHERNAKLVRKLVRCGFGQRKEQSRSIFIRSSQFADGRPHQLSVQPCLGLALMRSPPTWCRLQHLNGRLPCLMRLEMGCKGAHMVVQSRTSRERGALRGSQALAGARSGQCGWRRSVEMLVHERGAHVQALMPCLAIWVSGW